MSSFPVQVFQRSGPSFRPALLHLERGCCQGLELRSQGMSTFYLAPGFIDSHAHIYPGATDLGIPADRIGLATGVHLVVDAGSAGSTSFPCFRDYIVPTYKTEVKGFLNISRVGLITKQPYFDPRNLDLSATTLCIREDAGRLLLGIKVLSSGLVVEEAGLEPLRLAIQAGDQLGCPVMAHLVEGPPANRDTLPLMRPGDIITHIFHGAPNLEANRKASKGAAPDLRYCHLPNLMWNPDGTPIPPLAGAIHRGVFLDVGHGAASLDQAVAQAAISAGLRSFSISTDAHIRNVDTIVHSLAHTMSKFLALGMTLAEVVASVTTIPARQLGLAQWDADLSQRATLFRLRPVTSEDPPFLDAYRSEIFVKQVIEPVAVIKDGIFHVLNRGADLFPADSEQ